MPDPWSQPAPFKGTRFVCPFEDWWHDEPEDAVEEIPANVMVGVTTLQEMIHARVFAQLSAKYQRIDGLIRRHLESHTLEEWFAAAVKLQQLQHSANQAEADVAAIRRLLARHGACTFEAARDNLAPILQRLLNDYPTCGDQCWDLPGLGKPSGPCILIEEHVGKHRDANGFRWTDDYAETYDVWSSDRLGHT